MNLNEIILKPVLTEKAMDKQEENCYLLWVLPKANKNQIKRAVEKLFGVKPKTVRTARIGKKKKAFIQLSEGEEISLAKLSE
jgi:large subunit ribosomal protein L23